MFFGYLLMSSAVNMSVLQGCENCRLCKLRTEIARGQQSLIFKRIQGGHLYQS